MGMHDDNICISSRTFPEISHDKKNSSKALLELIMHRDSEELSPEWEALKEYMRQIDGGSALYWLP